jgi:3-keto-5-aminohexanoate cleavage enzyme
MDKLVITVAVDSTPTYPSNPNMPPVSDTEAIARQYIDAVSAGASICHHHGRYSLVPGPDGRNVMQADIDGFLQLSELIRAAEGDPIMQYGTGASLEQKLELLGQRPEMLSYPFTFHDLRLQPDPSREPFELYLEHRRDELAQISQAALDAGTKIEIETFGTGAYWNLEFIRDKGLLPDPTWITLMLGWSGGAWTPPSVEAVLYLEQHLPPRVNWSTSIMNTQRAWALIPTIIARGGHVRVGWEDNPYLPTGELATSNAQLVDAVVSIARTVGREIASPAEAREITGVAQLRESGATA